MKPLDFIKAWLNSNKDNVPIESALYEFHESSETHFLRFKPETVNIDEKFEELFSDLIISFDKEFPNVGLCLLREKSLTKLKNPVELIKQEAPIYNNAPQYWSIPITYAGVTSPSPNIATIKFSHQPFDSWSFIDYVFEYSAINSFAMGNGTMIEETVSVDDEPTLIDEEPQTLLAA